MIVPNKYATIPVIEILESDVDFIIDGIYRNEFFSIYENRGKYFLLIFDRYIVNVQLMHGNGIFVIGSMVYNSRYSSSQCLESIISLIQFPIRTFEFSK